jgi:uncharacterized membrane protein YqjE
MALHERSSQQSNGVRDDLRRGRQEARELGSEASDLANDVRYLIQKEGELARAEFQEAMGRTIQSAISAVIAIVFANIMLIFAFATVMFAFDEVFELWVAALITTGILLLITVGALAFAYARMKQVSFTPQRTMKSLREDIEWAKTQMRSTTR